jgi:hypothetical protein
VAKLLARLTILALAALPLFEYSVLELDLDETAALIASATTPDPSSKSLPGPVWSVNTKRPWIGCGDTGVDLCVAGLHALGRTHR